ncbi:hypothetical protein AAGV33_14730 [Flavobacterium sp. FBOR7N2.3]|uniref:Uncharacterized protein n=1 Tax=Flavobacterium magnesitis TaxID=3138077 RepID=A0ABV4TQJ6_9FLAO
MGKSNIIQRGIKTGNIYLVLMLLSFVFIIIKGCNSSKNEDNTEAISEAEKTEIEADIKADVIVAVQIEVEENLKSPSTADFPWVIEPIKVNDSTYTVASYVDSQNGFGAMIRANFVVEVIIDRQTKNTKAKLIMFEERQ